MFAKSTTRKRLSMVLCIVLALTLVVGSFAYFTDRVESNAKVKAGTVGITQANDWVNTLKDADGALVLDNVNPGDSRSLKFSVTNTGNKAVDVRHTIKLSVTDAKGAAKAMSMEADVAALQMLQFEIFKASDVELTSAASGNKGYVLKAGAEPLYTTDTGSYNSTSMMGATRVVDTTNGTVTYYFADSILDGVGAEAEVGYAKAEHVDTKLTGTDAVISDESATNKNNVVTYDYVLIFRDTTLNDFQGCQVHIDLEVEAKQHLNTNSSWEHIETIQTVLNASGVAAQDTTINVAPDNTIGVLNDVPAGTIADGVAGETASKNADAFNGHVPH